MATLKEIKTRIASDNRTGEITSAMEMVAASYMHQTQLPNENMLPYETMLEQIIKTFIASHQYEEIRISYINNIMGISYGNIYNL